jgi:peptidylprolyl isomerase
MKLRSLVVAVAAFAMAGSALAQDVSSEKGKLSYYFGYDYGNNLAELTARGEQLDINSVVKGLQDAYAKQKPALTAEQLKPALEAFQKREFIASFKAQPGVKTLPGGVAYKVLENGTGAKPTQASTVELQVAGAYPFGQRPSEARPPQQMKDVKVSAIEMQAMRDVLLQMPVGSKWEVALPPDKAYGADPRTGFPPNVAVVFEIKLVSAK